MNLVKQVTKWLEDRKIFSRKRKSNKQRALGMLSEMDSGFFRRRFWNDYIGKYSRGGMEQWLGSFAGFRNLMKDSKGILS